MSSSPTSSREELLSAALRAVGRTSAAHATFSATVAVQLGIGPTDLECLLLLQESGPASAGQLADVLGLTTGAITGVIDRLTAAGFVVRESDPADRRRVIVTSVDERVADVQRAYEPLLRSAAQSLTAYTDADLHLVLDFQRRAAQVMHLETLRQRDGYAHPTTAWTLAAPLGGICSGSLEFANGASELRVHASDQPGELYHAAFEGAQPTIRVQEGAVTFRYKRMGLHEWRKHSGSVRVNPTIPWSIAVRGGASGVVLDASRLQLDELAIDGGASKVEIMLPPPHGTVRVSIGGGLNNVHIVRPTGTPAQVYISGGANRLDFDDRHFGAVGGDVRLASPGWNLISDRYAIEAYGGASRCGIHLSDAISSLPTED